MGGKPPVRVSRLGGFYPRHRRSTNLTRNGSSNNIILLDKQRQGRTWSLVAATSNVVLASMDASGMVNVPQPLATTVAAQGSRRWEGKTGTRNAACSCSTRQGQRPSCRSVRGQSVAGSLSKPAQAVALSHLHLRAPFRCRLLHVARPQSCCSAEGIMQRANCSSNRSSRLSCPTTRRACCCFGNLCLLGGAAELYKVPISMMVMMHPLSRRVRWCPTLHL